MKGFGVGMLTIAVVVVFGFALLIGGCPKQPESVAVTPPSTPAVPDEGTPAEPAETKTEEATTGLKWVEGMDAGLKAAAAEKKPAMVDFYAEWCGWCKKLDEETYTDAKVKAKAQSFVCVKVDADEDKESASKYASEGLPTIVFLDSSGKEIHRIVGYKPAEEFLPEMETALSKAGSG